jgi:hypothetical protein
MTLRHDVEDWIAVYTRDTAGWSSLSWQARGISLELSRKLDARGELPLGVHGLASLAGLLRASWAEIEPFVLELLAEPPVGLPRLVFDAARNVVVDPQHVERQTAAVAAAAERLQPAMAATAATGAAMAAAAGRRPRRPLSMTPNAIRKRARRSDGAATNRPCEVDPSQLELPMAAAAAMAATAGSPLSDLCKSDHQTKQRRAPRPTIALAAGDVATSCAELAARVRPELPAEVVARSWRRFAIRKSQKFASWDVVEAEWESWIEREMAGSKGALPKLEQRPRTIVPARPAPPPPVRPRVPCGLADDFAMLFASGRAVIEARATVAA